MKKNTDPNGTGLSSVFLLVSFFFFILIDQVSKWVVYRQLVEYELFYYLGIKKFENNNFAFSIPLPLAVMYILYVTILSGIAWYLYHHWQTLSTISRIAWVAIIAGSVSNIGERIVLGYVRDFIHVGWGYFNVADACIITGIAVLFIFHKQVQTRNTDGNRWR